jgi:paraquat-inducible protein B
MSQKTNPAAVGLFVVGALALAALGLILLGGGRFFEPAKSFVLYFDGDLNGLDVGAPVTSRGVRIGEVQSISLVYDHEAEKMMTPVVIRVSGGVFEEVNAPSGTFRQINVGRMVDNGLRARLELLSVVTGKLRVNLDFHPETEAVFRGSGQALEEIPTLPTTLQNLTKQFSELPLHEIIEDVHTSMNQIAAFLESGTMNQTVEEMNSLIAQFSLLIEAREMSQTLDEVRDAARSLRVFIDYINRHPEALLRGKGNRP